MENICFDEIKHKNCVVRLVAALTRPVRSWLRHKFRSSCVFFYVEPMCYNNENDVDFVQIDTWEEFFKFARGCSFPVNRWQYERFRDDSSLRFVALVRGKDVLSYGWVTMENRSLTEGHDIAGLPILYDFATPAQHRRKGYYTKLLKELRRGIGGIIYALPSNEPSLRAIRAAGFVQYWPKV